MTLTVACVLKSGGPYGPEYVARLKGQVDEHLPPEHRFVCLSDVEVPCERVDLEHNWPGWWSKVELFRPDVFSGGERVLYLDLDTSVVGSLDEIAAYDGRFACPEDWNHPELGASGVMVWEAGPWVTDRIYRPFVNAPPEGAMQSHRGDQNWISGSVGWDPLREIYPGQIVSRWYECEGGVPEEARVVCWHGTPKPARIDWSLEGDREHWREQLEDGGYIEQPGAIR